jgi:lysozyme
VNVIKHFEGFYGKAYYCPANVLTIGYGHTGSDIKKGMIISKMEAEVLLVKDLKRFENHVKGRVSRLLLWHEFDALVSFSFNVGYRIKGELRTFINEGNTKLVVYKLMQYNKAKVKGIYIELKGLTRRRTAEARLYQNLIPYF